ncbi:hypothetical protein Tco_0374748 [Tanacetum coccineum]
MGFSYSNWTKEILLVEYVINLRVDIVSTVLDRTCLNSWQKSTKLIYSFTCESSKEAKRFMGESSITDARKIEQFKLYIPSGSLKVLLLNGARFVTDCQAVKDLQLQTLMLLAYLDNMNPCKLKVINHLIHSGTSESRTQDLFKKSRVTVEQVQGRQGSKGFLGEWHMARKCTQPKRTGMQQGVPDGQAITTIHSKTMMAFRLRFDTYNLSVMISQLHKAVLMANISKLWFEVHLQRRELALTERTKVDLI